MKLHFIDIHWGAPSNIWLAPLFILVIAAIIIQARGQLAAVQQLVHQRFAGSLLIGFSRVRRIIKTVSWVAALVFIFIALLQPQWGKKEEQVMQEGRDVLIALDVSRSMMAQDFSPNRLEFTKFKIHHLLEKLKSERVGLILFAGSAFLQCPLTVDQAAFSLFLNQVDSQVIASGTTAIDAALEKAMDVYAKSGERKNKLVIIATDGEDFSLNLEAIKTKAKEQNVRLFMWGVGTAQGAPIPRLLPDGKIYGHEADEKGNVVLSKLDKEGLTKIANELGGKFIAARNDDRDIDYLVKLVHHYEKEKISDRSFSLYEERYPWFLGAAWLLLALEWIL